MTHYAHSQRAPLLRLLDYMRGHRAQVNQAVLFSILNRIFDLAPPALIGAAVDIVVQQENSFFAQLGIVDTGQQLLVQIGRASCRERV